MTALVDERIPAAASARSRSARVSPPSPMAPARSNRRRVSPWRLWGHFPEVANMRLPFLTRRTGTYGNDEVWHSLHQCGGRNKYLGGEVSGNNRNVRHFMTVEMSADKAMSLRTVERLAPGVILGWTAARLGARLGGAVGRIGLCRSATRAPVGRLYARGVALLRGGNALFFPL